MPEPNALALLRSIDATLKALLALSQRRGAGGGPSGPAVASDADLDGKYGDPTIKAADPRDWSGESMKGRRYSECPAAYLDLVAQRCDWFAQQADEKKETANNGKPRSLYLRADAARARGWAARIRAGKVAQPPAAQEDAPEWAAGDTGWGQ